MLILGVCGWLTLPIPYHKWRWAACRATAERLRAGQNTMGDEFWGLFRRAPKTSTEYFAAATQHEDALIRLNHLARKEFRLMYPLASNSAMDRFTAAAVKRFPATREWAIVFAASGESVSVTATRRRMAEWEEFIRDYDGVRGAKVYPNCKRKQAWAEAVLPVRF